MRDVFVAQISLVQPFEVVIVEDIFRKTCDLLIDEFYTDLFIKIKKEILIFFQIKNEFLMKIELANFLLNHSFFFVTCIAKIYPHQTCIL